MDESAEGARPYRMDARARSAEKTWHRIVEAAASRFDQLLYDQVALVDVAAAAGVTVQTVLRRFGSKDELFAAVARQRSPDARRCRDQAPVGDVAGAIGCLIEDYERVGAHTLHLLAQERRTAAIAQAADSGRRYHRDWVARAFAPQLHRLGPNASELVLAQLIAVTDLYAWKVLREDAGLDPEQARVAVTGLVERILR